MSIVQENYKKARARIDSACMKAKRDRQSVRLLAVSKTKPAEMVRDCYQLGQTAFGENYLQDALAKIEALRDLTDIEWHFIGPLQSNKTKAVAENFHWLETLDREKIARRLNEQRPPGLPPLNVLIQINISDEDQKSGIPTTELPAFARTLAAMPRLKVRGLMCIPEATDDETRLQQQFKRMQQLSNDLVNHYPDANVLSMGMSGDLELAIACGSTEVRIGTDIFGARDNTAA